MDSRKKLRTFFYKNQKISGWDKNDVLNFLFLYSLFKLKPLMSIIFQNQVILYVNRPFYYFIILLILDKCFFS